MSQAVARANRVHDLLTEVTKLTPGIALKINEWMYLVNRQVHLTNLREVELNQALVDLAAAGKAKKSPLNRWYLL